MNYYIDLFTPETWDAFLKSDRSTSGFRKGQENAAKKIKPGDFLICYLTRISRWVGILEVKSKSFVDKTPIFLKEDDPFIIRFKVEPKVLLDFIQGIPIHNDIVWKELSFTKTLRKSSIAWTGMVRSSLKQLTNDDAKVLVSLLESQENKKKDFPFSEKERKNLKISTVRNKKGQSVTVSVPEDEDEVNNTTPKRQRKSIRIQSTIAEIGERMNLKIWIPKSDRDRVFKTWKPKKDVLLDELPFNYDEATIKTIENIDVLWIKGRSIVRAFEVEHTTSIYSGILRMADLMALQPNLNIKAHIVSFEERRQKVYQEITRPVFRFLDSGPLAEVCTFISYESIMELSEEKNLEYMKDDVLNQYEGNAEDFD